jgi:hypothetical protein
MKYLLCTLMLVASGHALAECGEGMPLRGTIALASCDPRSPNCVSAPRIGSGYLKKAKEDKARSDPASMPVWIDASPLHFYDSDSRILTVEDLAGMLRPLLAKRKTVKRVVLYGSWTGVAPAHGGKSLAQRLSQALNGMPVKGMDGYLWIAEDGSMHTTQAAPSPTRSGPYGIVPGAEIMTSYVTGWVATLSDRLVEAGNTQGILLAGAGWDTFFLCPDRALQTFEAAAKLSSPVAAYNAAILHLERGRPGDNEAAAALLAQAAAEGDEKAKARLAQLRRNDN